MNIDYMQQEGVEENQEENTVEKPVINEEYASDIKFEVIKA